MVNVSWKKNLRELKKDSFDRKRNHVFVQKPFKAIHFFAIHFKGFVRPEVGGEGKTPSQLINLNIFVLPQFFLREKIIKTITVTKF